MLYQARDNNLATVLLRCCDTSLQEIIGQRRAVDDDDFHIYLVARVTPTCAGQFNLPPYIRCMPTYIIALKALAIAMERFRKADVGS